MKAMILNRYGSTSSFEKIDIDKPVVKKGHVLVKVAATSVNTVDTMIKSMGEDLAPISPALPALLGMDFAGTVTELGAGVTEFVVGDEVYGCAGGLADLPGALAEFMLADTRLIAHKPKTVSMRDAAGLPLVGITAYEGLIRAGISKNQKILVHGGAGGVGHVALQLAKHFGADVYATGKNKSLSLIKKLGATAINYETEKVADYVEQYTSGKGFDLIYDSVGGENIAASFEAAALNAQIATTVSMLQMDLTLAHFKGLSLHVVFMLIPMLHDHQREKHGEILKKLAEIIDAGGLEIVVDNKEFSLEEIDAAHAYLTSGQALGKVVVTLP